MTKKLKERIGFHYLLTAVHFEYFGIEYIPLHILNKIKNKFITHNIFRTQHGDSIMYGFYCIAFAEQMIEGKPLFVRLYQFIFYS